MKNEYKNKQNIAHCKLKISEPFILHLNKLIMNKKSQDILSASSVTHS
jgi:hypothetical protein